MKTNIESYLGRRFGERTVIIGSKIGKGGQTLLLCRCDAGHESLIRVSHLNNGTGGFCKTCHCRRIATRHGEATASIKTASAIYRKWVNMISRCNNDESYTRRGIVVCDRWRIFENFKMDMGEPPDSRMQLDRRNGGKGYSPDNCRWVTRQQNNRNRINLRFVSFAGMTMCVADWEKYLNVAPDKLRKKLRCDRPLDLIMRELGFTRKQV